MKKFRTILCILFVFIFSVSVFMITACSDGENGGEESADKLSPFKKPSISEGVVLEEVTEFDAILQAINVIKTGMGWYDDRNNTVAQTDYALYGKVTINKVYNFYNNLDIDGVRYTQVDGVKTDGREYYSEMKYVSDRDGRAAKFDCDFIKTATYSDNLSVTEDYAKVETQKYSVTDKDGIMNRYFNGELEDSIPVEELKFSEFSNAVSGLYYIKNVEESNGREVYFSDVIANAEACALYNEGRKRLPVYWADYIETGNDWYDFDNERVDSLLWMYDKEEVTKHSLTVRTNSKQYWLDLDIEVKISNVTGSLIKFKSYQYTIYLDTEPSVTVRDIEEEIN